MNGYGLNVVELLNVTVKRERCHYASVNGNIEAGFIGIAREVFRGGAWTLQKRNHCYEIYSPHSR